MAIEIDNHKLMYHPERVAEWMKNGDCFPVYVEIGPTNRCNHRCVFCCYDFYVNKTGANISRQIMLKTLKDLADNGTKSVMFAGDGEPLLHENIVEFVEKAKEFGMDVSMTTNGNLLDSEKAEKILPNLSWIRVSLDAGSPETHSKVHGVSPENFEKIINNLKNAVEIKKKKNLKVVIGVQFLLIPDNAQDLIRVAQILKEIGVDNLQVKPYSQNPESVNKFVINYEEYAPLELELRKYNSPEFKVFFREQTMKRIEEGNVYPRCFGLSFFALIDAKGEIFPCSLFYNKPDFTYGNLYKDSFEEIWKSEKRKQILAKINPSLTGCRHGCRLDVVNRYLNRLNNPEMHDNFI